MVSMNYTTGIFLGPLQAVLEQGGIELGDLLQTLGIDDVAELEPGRPLSVRFTSALLDAAAQRLQDVCLGINMARHTDYSHFGALGLAVAAGGTIHGILMRMVRFTRLITDVVTPRLDSGDGDLILRFERAGSHLPHPQAMLFVLTCIVGLLRLRVSPDLAPTWIQLPPGMAASEAGIRRFFKCPIRRGNDFVLGFAQSVSQQLLSNSDPEMADLLEVSLHQRLKRQADETFTATLSRWIETMLPEGEPRLTDAARHHHLSTRTLQRKLQDDGESWHQLVEQARRRVVERHLGMAGYSVTQLAFLAGYSDSSAFSRAFKKWYGVAPTQYLAQEK